MHRINKLTIGSEMFAKKKSLLAIAPHLLLCSLSTCLIELKNFLTLSKKIPTQKKAIIIFSILWVREMFFRNLKDSGCKMLIMLHTLIFSLLHVTMNLRRKFFTSWEMMIKISAQTQREIHVCIKKEKEQEAKFIVFSCECNILSHLILHFVLLHLNRNKFLNRGTHGPCGEC